jgi:hypothetical protein
MAYEDVLKKFEAIQLEIKNSNHDRLSYEDYEASQEEIDDCLKDFGLGIPDWIGKDLMLPEEIWNEAFGETETEEEVDRIMASPEYKKLVEIYGNLYDQVVVIATEMSAYYAREAEDYEKYLDSMRGII